MRSRRRRYLHDGAMGGRIPCGDASGSDQNGEVRMTPSHVTHWKKNGSLHERLFIDGSFCHVIPYTIGDIATSKTWISGGSLRWNMDNARSWTSKTRPFNYHVAITKSGTIYSFNGDDYSVCDDFMAGVQLCESHWDGMQHLLQAAGVLT